MGKFDDPAFGLLALSAPRNNLSFNQVGNMAWVPDVMRNQELDKVLEVNTNM